MKYFKKIEIEDIIEFKDDIETFSKLLQYIYPLTIDYSDPKNPLLKIIQNDGVVYVPTGYLIVILLDNVENSDSFKVKTYSKEEFNKAYLTIDDVR